MKFDLHFLFSGKYAQWISLAFILFFALLIIIEWSHLVFLPVSFKPLPKAEQEMQVMTKQNSFYDILRSSLFGVYVSNNLNESSVKKSMLKVTVVGILLADKRNNSQVIIRSANGNEKIYKLGDKMPGGVVIKRIVASGILVDRHGTLESLSLPKNELIFEPVAKPLQEE